MDAQAVFENLKSHGARLRVEGDQLRIAVLGNKKLTDEQRELIRMHKPELMVLAAENPIETAVKAVTDGRRKCLHCQAKHVNWIPKLDGKWECGRCHADSVFKTDPPLIQPVEQQESDAGESDVWEMKLPFQTAEQDAIRNIRNDGEIISPNDATNGLAAPPLMMSSSTPTRAEIEERVAIAAVRLAEAFDKILPDIDFLQQVRENAWWKICDCASFAAFCRKYIGKTSRRVNQLIEKEVLEASLSDEAAKIFRKAPENQVRAIADIPRDKQAEVAYEAARIAAARPAPVGERARFAPRDEDGNAVNKISLADIQAATIAILAPPPPITESLFDMELRTGKTERNGKPSLPILPTDTTPPDDSDFAQTEAEALAIVRGEVVEDEPGEEAEETEQQAFSGVLQAKLKGVIVFDRKANSCLLRGTLDADTVRELLDKAEGDEIEFRLDAGLQKFPHSLFEARK